MLTPMSLNSLIKWLPLRELFQLIYVESERPKLQLGILALVSGVSNALLLALVNNASHKSVDETAHVETSTFFIFSFTLLLFAYSKRYTLKQGATLVEEIMRKLRVRIITKLSQTDLRFIETSGRGYIFNRLTQDTALISSTAVLLFASMESAVMLAGAMVYLVWLDPVGALMTIFATALGVLFYLRKRKQIMLSFTNATDRENEFVDYFLQQIEAFKELKINRTKALALLEIQVEKARAVELEKVHAGESTTTVVVFSQVWFYILLGIIIFVLPTLGNTPVDNVVKLTTAILFIIGPIEMLVGALPNYMRTDVAISRLKELEEMIDKAIPRESTDENRNSSENFKAIQFNNVSFAYRKRTSNENVKGSAKAEKRKRRRLYDPNAAQQDEVEFALGPLTFTINAGEIVFLIGGNGSGKTTLLKLLTGLYSPDSGTIRAFDNLVGSNNYQTYRELYTTIFSDFYLFKELFGMGQIDSQQLSQWLE